jgi:hypothetical protein
VLQRKKNFFDNSHVKKKIATRARFFFFPAKILHNCHQMPSAAKKERYDSCGEKVHELLYAKLLKGVKILAKISDPARFSCHSLRRGAAFFATAAGVPAYFIKLQGDWSSDCHTQYIALSTDSRKKAPSQITPPASGLLGRSLSLGFALQRAFLKLKFLSLVLGRKKLIINGN